MQLAQLRQWQLAPRLAIAAEFAGADPLTVKPSVEYTTRESFHKHAELNRDEHTRIRHELDKRVGSLEKDHHGLAREVSGVQSTLAANGQTLVLIGQKLDTLILKMGEKL